jgi:SNF2 family DNA or RNA helicase
VLPDLSVLSHRHRVTLANRIHDLPDFALPELKYFRSDPCPDHETIEEGLGDAVPCQQCGIRFRKHQRVGIAWLYMVKKGLIADTVGSGKTAIAVGLLAALKEVGELDGPRALIVCRPAALFQWSRQVTRFTPALHQAMFAGTRPQRIERYLQPWDVGLIGSQMLCKDLEVVENFDVRTLIVDDVDPLSHGETTTAYTIKKLAENADRVVIMTATSLQKRLLDLYSVLEPLGGRDVFGSEENFRRLYVREERKRFYAPKAGRYQHKTEIVGYKNLDDFRAKVAPMALRRTAEDIDDVDLPQVVPVTVMLDLHAEQRRRYNQLRKGVLPLIRNSRSVTKLVAGQKFLYGQQICLGLFALGEEDGPGSSVKLDWVVDKMTGDLSEEKAVVFVNFKPGIRALQARLNQVGVGNVVIWGEEPDKKVRWAAQERFWQDPDCRVLMGTTAIEQSLNLQVAAHLINVDTILNAARMTQLMGRIRRDGSRHRSVYVHNLLAADTQEAGYLDVLRREQALQDYVWEEQSDLYEALSPHALLMLIGSSSAQGGPR